MSTDRIKISEEFNMGKSVWLSIERDVPEGADPIQEFIKARNILTQSFNALSGNYYSGVQGHPQAEQQKPIPEVQTDSKEEQILGFVEAVQLCTSLTALNRFKTRVGELKDPRLTTAYEEKEKEFNNKKESAGNGGC